jgi:transcriptional regulator PpsR
MKAFTSPARWFAGIDADAAALLIAAAADVAVILDPEGIVRDRAFQSEAFALEFAENDHWTGRPWRDTVTVESRNKIDKMLRDVHDGLSQTGRQVNYPAVRGDDIPILFSVLPVGQTKQAIAFGRDLRAFATLQQRVVEVQQSFERDYSRIRHIETRYRILFQMAPEPVFIAELASQKIVEANPAARQLPGPKGKIIGLTLSSLVEKSSLAALETLLSGVKGTGRADDIPLRLAGGGAQMLATAFLFRQGNAKLLLLRLSHPAQTSDQGPVLTDSREKMLKLIERVPDGFVVTSHDGIIIAANEAFLELAQLRGEAEAQGKGLDRWLGRPGVDLPVLLNNLREFGTVRLFATILRDEFDAEHEVEVSAGSVLNAGEPCYGFAIRGISRRVVLATSAPRAFPKSLEQIIELIGRVSLKDLVREATDVIERLSIEAALSMTGDNRASAAEILGVSRQSLYVKMRRHGLIDAETISIE